MKTLLRLIAIASTIVFFFDIAYFFAVYVLGADIQVWVGRF